MQELGAGLTTGNVAQSIAVCLFLPIESAVSGNAGTVVRRHSIVKNATLSLAAVLVTAIACELLLRALVSPSDDCYGRLAGIELPPCRLRLPYSEADSGNRPEPFPDLVVDDRQVTYGDLWGIARYDAVMGFTAREEAASVNGWWRTDARGARIGRGAEMADTAGTRILVLGDSFAVGSRLPYEKTWSFALDNRHSDISVINFGMDGFSMAQAYLRYQSVRDSVEHDLVLLMFVPEEDLWRDVNVRRDVGANWPMYWVLPRFALLDGRLELIRSPFVDQDSERLQPPEGTRRKLEEHLRAFDRFYFGPRYEPPGVAGHSVVSKLMSAALHKYRLRQLRSDLLNPDSEAMRVSAAIFRALQSEVAADGKQFVLAVLPSERALESKGRKFWERWDRMIETVCSEGIPCIDLSEELRRLPRAEIDRGYDHTHFGPSVNREIARILADHLLEPESSSYGGTRPGGAATDKP